MNMRLNLLAILCGLAGNIQAMNRMTPEECKNLENAIQAASTYDQVVQLIGGLNADQSIEFSFTDGFYIINANDPEDKIITDHMKILNRCLCQLLSSVERADIDQLIAYISNNLRLKYPISRGVVEDICYLCGWVKDPNFLPLHLQRDQFDQKIAEFRTFMTNNGASDDIDDHSAPLFVPSKRTGIYLGIGGAVLVAACYATYTYWWSGQEQQVDEQDEENVENSEKQPDGSVPVA